MQRIPSVHLCWDHTQPSGSMYLHPPGCILFLSHQWTNSNARMTLKWRLLHEIIYWCPAKPLHSQLCLRSISSWVLCFVLESGNRNPERQHSHWVQYLTYYTALEWTNHANKHKKSIIKPEFQPSGKLMKEDHWFKPRNLVKLFLKKLRKGWECRSVWGPQIQFPVPSKNEIKRKKRNQD